MESWNPNPEAWGPLTGMPDGAARWSIPGYGELAAEWRDIRSALKDRERPRAFVDLWPKERLRAFAIETGQIEGLYTLRRGVTEQLIAAGFSGAGGARLAGTEHTTPHGLETSPAGEWLYVAGWRGEKLTRLSRGRTPQQKDVVPMGFRPDNLRSVDGGAVILAAGHGDFGTPEETSNVALVDPETLEVRRIFQHPRMEGFASSTAAIRIAGEIWLGTNRGGMIAYFPDPDGAAAR